VLQDSDIQVLAGAEASGWATSEDVALLESDREEWALALHRLISATEDGLVAAEALPDDIRPQVLADFNAEIDRLAGALLRVSGEDRRSRRPAAAPSPQEVPEPASAAAELPTAPVLQGSWAAGRIVVWAGSPGAGAASSEVVDELLTQVDGTSIAWKPCSDVVVPHGEPAPARSAPVEEMLGWLVGVGVAPSDAVGPSLRWLSEVARWGTDLVAQGRMVPSLRRAGGSRSGPRRSTDRYRVKWVPALVDSRRIKHLASRAPVAVTAVERTITPEALCRSLLGVVVDAVCRAGAARLEFPATAALARNRNEMAEAFLSGLKGAPFSAAADQAGQLAERINEWTSPVSGESPFGLVVRLDPPEDDGGWLLAIEVSGVERRPLAVERALTAVPRGQMRQIEAMVQRAERLLPALRRPSTRRGQVVLSSDEAADLLFGGAAMLEAVGFEVHLPAFSRRPARPKLRLHADSPGRPSQVGMRQLSQVRWSVLFGDTELDAREIARLAAEARPLVQVNGRWVRVDQADLAAAAAALRERSNVTEMSGAAIVRQAVGLGGGTLGGPVDVVGSGWAVELIQGTTEHPPEPLHAPPGFRGELRAYQAEAAGWLAFLDRSGLGGCLAMDMGLGKTPTVLAHLLANRGDGPNLVVCPPAVLGNWSREAHRFTPALRVEVHHGATRADAGSVVGVAGRSDIILTTYATAMRDADALGSVDWARIIVDEAQAIKNSSSDTAQALRTIPARTRIAMTGTPVENGLGDLWSILDFTNPGLVGPRNEFIDALSRSEGAEPAGERALRALNGLLVFRRTKAEPAIAAELSDKIDVLDHCSLTPEQVGLYQAIIDRLLDSGIDSEDTNTRKAHVLAAITALKQVCNHPAAYVKDDDQPLAGRSGKLERLEEIVANVFAAGEKLLVFTHFATWGEKLATYLSNRTGMPIACYHGGLARGMRDKLVHDFQSRPGPGALVLSLKAGGAGLNLTAASHVVLYDRWWNPAVEDQARDRAWRIGQQKTVISHRLVCPGTIDERVEEVVAGKRHIANLVLPARSTLGDIDREQLRAALGLTDEVLVEEPETMDSGAHGEEAA
jgi:hypothetical protein